MQNLSGLFYLILLGNGVVANVVLKDTKGHDGGWIVISLGWGLGVFVGVAVAGPVSGAHINPAVTLGLATAGMFSWSQVLPFIAAQMAGAAAGAFTVWLFYRHHFNRTEDPDAQLACFSTAPAIRKPVSNFISELIGTFVLIFVILYIAEPSLTLEGEVEAKIGLGTLGALPVALLVTAIGLISGGNHRVCHQSCHGTWDPGSCIPSCPWTTKGSSDWNYAWIPVIGPFAGALVAALLFLLHGILIG